MLGYKRAEMLRFQEPGTPGPRSRCSAGCNEPSVVDAFYDFLEQHGVAIPTESARARRDVADRAQRSRGRGHPAALQDASPTWKSCSS